MYLDALTRLGCASQYVTWMWEVTPIIVAIVIFGAIVGFFYTYTKYEQITMRTRTVIQWGMQGMGLALAYFAFPRSKEAWSQYLWVDRTPVVAVASLFIIHAAVRLVLWSNRAPRSQHEKDEKRGGAGESRGLHSSSAGNNGDGGGLSSLLSGIVGRSPQLRDRRVRDKLLRDRLGDRANDFIVRGGTLYPFVAGAMTIFQSGV